MEDEGLMEMRAFLVSFLHRLNIPKYPLQLGQLWWTSMHLLMQHGIRQQPKGHPIRQMRNPAMYAISPGFLSMVVSISARQCGQIMCVCSGPKGTTVVIIVGPFFDVCMGVYGLDGATPPTA